MNKARQGRSQAEPFRGKSHTLMPQRKRKSVAAYHDRVAHRYDDVYDDLFWRWHDALTWDYLKPFLPRDQSGTVIDLGCGTGKWGLRIARSGYSVTCVDISTKMLDTVERKAGELGLEDRVNCVHADLMDLKTLPDAGFELAVAFGEPLSSTERPLKALGEIHKIIKSDGLLVATIDNRLNSLDFFLENSDIDGLARFIKDGRTHWLTKDEDERFELQTFSPEQTKSLLQKTGFELVELLGKTVLPMRKFRELLEDRARFQQLLTIEKKLSRKPDAIGRAPHTQFVARKASP